jgi:hypothetical protein
MLEGCDGLEKDLGSRVPMGMGARESIADESQFHGTLSLVEHKFDLAQSPSAGRILQSYLHSASIVLHWLP